MVKLNYIRCKGVLVHPAIVRSMEELLDGHPAAVVTSGWRSPERNRRVGGAARSRHLVGTAIDITGPAQLLDHLEAAAGAYGAIEILRESDHLHVGWRRPD